MRNASKSAARAGSFSAEERAAMKERVRELKSRGSKGEMEKEVLAKIAGLADPDRTLAERLHAIMKSNAPNLSPKLWYGMPAYARGDKVVCYFQDARKFKARYATLGFSDQANLDDGDLWSVAFALKGLSAADEARIVELVRRAAR